MPISPANDNSKLSVLGRNKIAVVRSLYVAETAVFPWHKSENVCCNETILRSPQCVAQTQTGLSICEGVTN